MSSDVETPGDRLRFFRRKAGLSASELGVLAAVKAGRPRPISPSAIRNQENGTNGIPYPLAEAYGAILDVPAQFILFGDSGSADLAQFRASEEDYEARRTADYFIPRMGRISAKWAEQYEYDADEVGLEIRIPGYSAGDLRAYEADGSLSPIYPKGSLILTAHHTIASIHDRSHVVATMTSDELYLESLREIRVGPQGVDLIGIGEKSPAAIALKFELGAPRIRIDQVVVASVNVLPRPNSPPLRLNKFYSVPENGDID
ncbi:helix-turn-helix domain-containing protein [Caulobacter sp. DWP3-1-3b2]|uniref:helix-turn-helix domain-containing protein n=1 Tax=Caulobacter sp. DWP3-1-3b2 TaxID=2804643 RepID=UPI003CECC648